MLGEAMCRSMLRMVLAAVAIIGLAAPLAAEPKAEQPKVGDGVGKKADRPVKDVAEEAFALPKGVVLSAKQAEAYRQIREQFKPLLQIALERVESSTDEKEKLKAVAEVKKIRQAIQQAILDILKNPPFDPKDASKKTQGKKSQHAKKNAHRAKHAAKHRAASKVQGSHGDKKAASKISWRQ
jgi:hypothetical protein